jgi:hypothetical protein
VGMMKMLKRVLRVIIVVIGITGMLLCVGDNQDTITGVIGQFVIGVFMMIPFVALYWDKLFEKE